MRKKILIVSAFLPYPLNAGGNTGPFEMINYFRDKYDISFLFSFHRNVAQKDLEELAQIWDNVTFFPYKKSFKEKVYRVLYNLSYKIFRFFFSSHYLTSFLKDKKKIEIIERLLNPRDQICDHGFVNYVNQVIMKNKFDLVQVEYYEVLSLPIFINIPSPLIFIHHELRYVKHSREIASGVGADKCLQVFLEQNKAYELELLKLYDKILVMSDVDKNYLSQYFSEEKVYTSPSSVRDVEKRFKKEDYSFNNTLFFLGGENHFPNKDGLIWFFDNCWETIRQQNSLLKLKIIGNWSEATIKKYSSKHIDFLGFVPELFEAIKNGIMIVPLRIGSGIRIKILDSVINGVPFVTTTIGVEGLKFEDGLDCFICDTPDDFVSKTLELSTNEIIQKQFIENAYHTFEENYSFNKAVEKRENLYQIFLNNGKSK